MEAVARTESSQWSARFAGWVGLPLIAGLLSLAALTALIGFTVAYRSQAGWVAHTVEVERELARVLAIVQDAELGQRGYLLTEDEAFLVQFERARANLPNEIDRLATLTADNTQQQDAVASLRELSERRIEIISETLTQMREGNRREAVRLMRAGPGRPTMAAFRAIIGEMEAREDVLALERRARAAYRLLAVQQWCACLAVGNHGRRAVAA